MAEFNDASNSSGFVDELALARQRREVATASGTPNSGKPQSYDLDAISVDRQSTDALDPETIRQARIAIARQDALNAAGPLSPEAIDRRKHDDLARQLAARLPGFTTKQLEWLEYAFNNVDRAANTHTGNETTNYA